MSRIRSYFHSLIGHITLVMLCAVIPVIIVAVGILGIFFSDMNRQLIVANENELQQYMLSLDTEFAAVERDLNEVIADNWTVFRDIVNAPKYNEYYNFMLDMREVRESHALVTISFFCSGNSIDNAWVGYDPEQMNYRDAEEMRRSISGMTYTTDGSRHFSAVQINGNLYLMFYISNYNEKSVIGVLLSAGELLERLTLTDPGRDENFLAVDGRLYDSAGSVDMEGTELITSEDSGSRANRAFIYVPSSSWEIGAARLWDRMQVFSSVSGWQWGLMFIAVFSVPASLLVWLAMRRQVLFPLERLHGAMREIEKEHIDYRMEQAEDTREFEFMRQEFNHMADEIKDLRIQSYEREIEKLQIEATNLRLQVSPHMLMNSLNMIYNLSLSRNFKVLQQFVLCLSEYFRYSLQKHEELVPISDELHFVDNYLKVQKVRFPQRFVYVYDVDEELLSALIPPLLIQNFVENTIKYGLKMDEEIEIIMIVKKRGEKLELSVVDTGAGMTPEVLAAVRSGEIYTDRNGKHIGLWNCRRRLRMIYGESDIKITSEPGNGTQIWVEIPLRVKTEPAKAGREEEMG